MLEMKHRAGRYRLSVLSGSQRNAVGSFLQEGHICLRRNPLSNRPEFRRFEA